LDIRLFVNVHNIGLSKIGIWNVNMRIKLKEILLLTFALLSLSSYSSSATQIRALAKAIGSSACEGGSFSAIPKGVHLDNPISASGITYAELLETIQLKKSFEDKSAKKISEIKFKTSQGDGYRQARSALQKIISDLKKNPALFDIELKSFTGYSYDHLGNIISLRFEYLQSRQIIEKLEQALLVEDRVGYFPMLAREIIMLNQFFADSSIRATHFMSASENYGSWLQKFLFYHKGILNLKAFSFPFPDHFGDIEMAMTWSLGIVPLGISTHPDISYDGLISSSLYAFASHDDSHFAVALERFLQHASYGDSHLQVADFYTRLSELPSDKDVLLITFLWSYVTHELDLLSQIRSDESINSLLFSGRQLSIKALIRRVTNRMDLYEGLPTYLKEIALTDSDSELHQEFVRGIDLLYLMLTE
jgi:hypothetical protein